MFHLDILHDELLLSEALLGSRPCNARSDGAARAGRARKQTINDDPSLQREPQIESVAPAHEEDTAEAPLRTYS